MFVRFTLHSLDRILEGVFDQLPLSFFLSPWKLPRSSDTVLSFYHVCVLFRDLPDPPVSCSRGPFFSSFCCFRALSTRRERTGTVLLCGGDVLGYGFIWAATVQSGTVSYWTWLEVQHNTAVTLIVIIILIRILVL